MISVIRWQQIEGTVIFITGILVYSELGTGPAWWISILLFFVPDISIAGYLIGPRAGAFIYNLIHTYAFGLFLLLLGLVSGKSILILLGALWFGHSGFDRMLGFGLKTGEKFRDTHLAQIRRTP